MTAKIKQEAPLYVMTTCAMKPDQIKKAKADFEAVGARLIVIEYNPHAPAPPIITKHI